MKLAPGQGQDRRISESFETDSGERCVYFAAGEAAPCQRHQTAHAEGQRGAERQLLRNIADIQGWGPFDNSLADVDLPQNRTCAGRLSGPVGTDNVDRFFAGNFNIHVPDNPSLATLHANVSGANEQNWRSCVRIAHGKLSSYRETPPGQAQFELLTGFKSSPEILRCAVSPSSFLASALWGKAVPERDRQVAQ